MVDLTLSSSSSPEHEVQIVPSENPEGGEPKSKETGHDVETEECPISKIPAVPTNLNTSTITTETEVGKTTNKAEISEDTSKEMVTSQATISIIATKKTSDKSIVFLYAWGCIHGFL